MTELERIAVAIGEALYYIEGVASTAEGGPDYTVVCEKLDDARSNVISLNRHGRYVPNKACGIPFKERAYARTRADLEALLMVEDVSLSEATGIPEKEADRIVFLNTSNDLLDLRHVADALGITLDELFWKLYKLADPKES